MEPAPNRKPGDPLAAPDGPTVTAYIYSTQDDAAQAQADVLAVEEPLEIRIRCGTEDAPRTVSLTMRTPGKNPREDVELALGFLFSEGVIRETSDVVLLPDADGSGERNVIELGLRPGLFPKAEGLQRFFYTTSACGVCGKTALEALSATPSRPLPSPDRAAKLPLSVLHGLPQRLREAQAGFELTGGLHAAGLFDHSGRLLSLREDVGRHNAVDKLLGDAFLRGGLPLWDAILLVSGRASFELVQKARMAGVPIFVAVGAPSSLAVTLAREAQMTLCGFAKKDRCNVYSAPERLALLPKHR